MSKWRSFEKRAIFDLLFTFFWHQGKRPKKIPSGHIPLTYVPYFAHPFDIFAFPILQKKKNRLYHV